jgi:hypothetical protein
MLLPVAAYPDDDSSFTGWGGDLEGSGQSLTLTVTNDTSFVAYFYPVPEPCGIMAAVLALLFAVRSMKLRG